MSDLNADSGQAFDPDPLPQSNHGASGDLGPNWVDSLSPAVNTSTADGRLGTGISAVIAGTAGFLLGGPIGLIFGVGAVVTVSLFNTVGDVGNDLLSSTKQQAQDSLNKIYAGLGDKLQQIGLISEIGIAVAISMLLVWLGLKLFV